MYVVIVAFPIDRSDSFCFEFWMAFLEAPKPVLAWRLDWLVRGRPPAGDTKG